MVNPPMTSESELRIQKVQALRDLAQARLRPPERERVLGMLDAAVQDATGSNGASDLIRRAEEKAARAEADREEKRRPYEADPLFMYLWRRRYGTRDYRASPLVRYFDRKVAHHIGYEAARVNYTMLLELPDRLREHAERLKKEPGPRGNTRPSSDALAAVERQPDVVALLRDARENPGSDEAVLRRIAEIEAALAGSRAISA